MTQPQTISLSDFLLARIAEDEEPTWRLLPYDCPPDCCAPAGYVGHECLICRESSFGGTPAAITEIGEEHAEQIHGRSRALAECEAKRRIVGRHKSKRAYDDSMTVCLGCGDEAPCDDLRDLALPYADHPDYDEEWRA